MHSVRRLSEIDTFIHFHNALRVLPFAKRSIYLLSQRRTFVHFRRTTCLFTFAKQSVQFRKAICLFTLAQICCSLSHRNTFVHVRKTFCFFTSESSLFVHFHKEIRLFTFVCSSSQKIRLSTFFHFRKAIRVLTSENFNVTLIIDFLLQIRQKYRLMLRNLFVTTRELCNGTVLTLFAICFNERKKKRRYLSLYEDNYAKNMAFTYYCVKPDVSP